MKIIQQNNKKQRIDEVPTGSVVKNNNYVYLVTGLWANSILTSTVRNKDVNHLCPVLFNLTLNAPAAFLPETILEIVDAELVIK